MDTTETIAGSETAISEPPNRGATPQPIGTRCSPWIEAAQSLTATIVIAVFIITFALQAFQIPSESMEDTLLVGDFLLVDKLRFGNPKPGWLLPYRPVQRGDVIVFLYPPHPAQHFVKRVIGMPGDHIRLENRHVFVNGSLFSEDYVRFKELRSDLYRDNFPRSNVVPLQVDARWWLRLPRQMENGELVVPAGQYFVLGDNRDKSFDSRYWGFVPRENIIGRPLVIYWSMRSTEGDLPPSKALSDMIFHFAYVATHILQVARWERTLRIVH